MVNSISPMEPSTKESLILKASSMAMACSTIQVAKFATLVAGKAILFMVLESCITKHPKRVKNKLHIGVSI